MPRKQRVDSSVEEESLSLDGTDLGNEDEVAVVESIKTIQSAFRRFRSENEVLKEEVSALRTQIEVLRASANASPSRGKANSTTRIKDLEKELKATKNDVKKYKSRYEKLQAAELKREKRELETSFEEGSNTLEDRYLAAKKLLRSHRALVEEIVLEDPDDEQKYPDCAICYEELSKDTAAAFPCEHIFHMVCIRELERHARERVSPALQCPTCRHTWHISGVVRVSRTAGEQWQDLIVVATEWAKLDVTRDDADIETSDKTSEPSFIENDLESAEDEEEEQVGAINGEYGGSEAAGRSLELDSAPQTPPRSQKRRRLEELAATRSAKKQNR